MVLAHKLWYVYIFGNIFVNMQFFSNILAPKRNGFNPLAAAGHCAGVVLMLEL